MGKTWKFQIDGYAAETSDPYLAELIQHLMDQVKTANLIKRAFIALIEIGLGVASSDEA